MPSGLYIRMPLYPSIFIIYIIYAHGFLSTIVRIDIKNVDLSSLTVPALILGFNFVGISALWSPADTSTHSPCQVHIKGV